MSEVRITGSLSEAGRKPLRRDDEFLSNAAISAAAIIESRRRFNKAIGKPRYSEHGLPNPAKTEGAVIDIETRELVPYGQVVRLAEEQRATEQSSEQPIVSPDFERALTEELSEDTPDIEDATSEPDRHSRHKAGRFSLKAIAANVQSRLVARRAKKETAAQEHQPRKTKAAPYIAAVAAAATVAVGYWAHSKGYSLPGLNKQSAIDGLLDNLDLGSADRAADLVDSASQPDLIRDNSVDLHKFNLAADMAEQASSAQDGFVHVVESGETYFGIVEQELVNRSYSPTGNDLHQAAQLSSYFGGDPHWDPNHIYPGQEIALSQKAIDIIMSY